MAIPNLGYTWDPQNGLLKDLNEAAQGIGQAAFETQKVRLAQQELEQNKILKQQELGEAARHNLVTEKQGDTELDLKGKQLAQEKDYQQGLLKEQHYRSDVMVEIARLNNLGKRSDALKEARKALKNIPEYVVEQEMTNLAATPGFEDMQGLSPEEFKTKGTQGRAMALTILRQARMIQYQAIVDGEVPPGDEEALAQARGRVMAAEMAGKKAFKQSVKKNVLVGWGDYWDAEWDQSIWDQYALANHLYYDEKGPPEDNKGKSKGTEKPTKKIPFTEKK